MWGGERDAPVAVDWLGGYQFVGYNNSYSHESEHDLGVMVSDFVENGSGGADSCWYSSDSESAFSDFADNISVSFSLCIYLSILGVDYFLLNFTIVVVLWGVYVWEFGLFL